VRLTSTAGKYQHTKADDYTRGFKSRGGVDELRHRDEALKKVVPWMKNLATTTPILLEDGAPAHISRIANDYLHTEQVDKLSWPGHSPEVNASEHAWPWIRRHITKNYPLSGTIDQCEQHWREQWEALPQEVINKWIDGIPDVVRKIIEYGGKNNFHDGGG
jgi:transposase